MTATPSEIDTAAIRAHHSFRTSYGTEMDDLCQFCWPHDMNGDETDHDCEVIGMCDEIERLRVRLAEVEAVVDRMAHSKYCAAHVTDECDCGKATLRATARGEIGPAPLCLQCGQPLAVHTPNANCPPKVRAAARGEGAHVDTLLHHDFEPPPASTGPDGCRRCALPERSVVHR